MADHSTFVVEVETNTLTGFFPTLGRKVIDGELDDLEQGIVHNKLPTCNRALQNRMAGTTQGVLILLLAAISFAFGEFGRHVHIAVGISVFLVSFAFLFNVFNYFKLPGLPFPSFPIHNPPGAELVHVASAVEVPVAPKKR
jgi:hypothetical protein